MKTIFSILKRTQNKIFGLFYTLRGGMIDLQAIFKDKKLDKGKLVAEGFAPCGECYVKEYPYAGTIHSKNYGWRRRQR